MDGPIGIAAKQAAIGADPERATAIDEKRVDDGIDAGSLDAVEAGIVRTEIEDSLAVGGAAPNSALCIFVKPAGNGPDGRERIRAEAGRSGAAGIEASNAIGRGDPI